METGKIKILPTDGAQACRPIGLDRRQLGMIREEGTIVDYENMKERLVTLGKTRICLRMVLQYLVTSSQEISFESNSELALLTFF